MANQREDSESHHRESAQPPWDMVVGIGFRPSFAHHGHQTSLPNSYPHTPYESDTGLTERRQSYPVYSERPQHAQNSGSQGSALGDSQLSRLGGGYYPSSYVPQTPVYYPHQYYHTPWPIVYQNGYAGDSWGRPIPPSPSVTASSASETSHVIIYPPPSNNIGRRPSASFSGLLEQHPQHRRNLSLGNVSPSKDLITPEQQNTGSDVVLSNAPWAVTDSLTYTSSSFKSPEPRVRLRAVQACEKCRVRKAKCSGDRPSCDRCISRGLACTYAPERKMRGPNKRLKRQSMDNSAGTGKPKSNGVKRTVSDVSRGGPTMVKLESEEYSSAFAERSRTSSPHVLEGPSIARLRRNMPSLTDPSQSPSSMKIEELDVTPGDWSNNGYHAERVDRPTTYPSTSLRRTYITPISVNTHIGPGSYQELDACSSIGSSCETSPLEYHDHQSETTTAYQRSTSLLSPIPSLAQNTRQSYIVQYDLDRYMDTGTPTTASNSPVTPASADSTSYEFEEGMVTSWPRSEGKDVAAKDERIDV